MISLAMKKKKVPLEILRWKPRLREKVIGRVGLTEQVRRVAL